MSDYLINQQVPSGLRSSIPQNEDILAVLKESPLWIVAYWLNPINWILICVLGLSIWVFLYRFFVVYKNTALILTNKRIIGSLNPKFWTKDKVDLPLSRVNGMFEDETFWGNIFGYSTLRVDTNGYMQKLPYARKQEVKNFKDKFYSLL